MSCAAAIDLSSLLENATEHCRQQRMDTGFRQDVHALFYHTEVKWLMKKNRIVLYFLLLAAALFLTAYSGSVPKEEPQLQLELVLSKNKYEAGEPIECKALLTYVGDQDEIKVYFRNPAVTFVVDGGEYMRKDQYNWATRDVFLAAGTRILKKGEPLEIPFQKHQYKASFSQRTTGDEAENEFWENYRSTSELMLEPGRYKMYARLGYSLKYATLSGPFEEIVISKKFTVK